MKITICAVAGPGINLVDRVHAELRETDARYQSRQLDRHRTMFDNIGWDDIGIGKDPFWILGCLVDSRDESLRLWARSIDAIPNDKREQVEQVLRQANSWKYCDGRFTGVDGANVVRYSTPPVTLEALDYGLKGAFEVADDLLSKVTPGLRKAMVMDGYATQSVSDLRQDCISDSTLVKK